MKLRKQYHFRPSPNGIQAWDIERLIALTRELPVIRVTLADIRELDEPYWFGDGRLPTCANIIDHARLIQEADLQYPVILSSDGRVMDGMHRIAKAVLENLNSVSAKQFVHDPLPDYVGVSPDDLPYD